MPTLPTDSKLRKEVPILYGVLRLFPAAIAGVAQRTYFGNMKHCDSAELTWDRSKSGDEAEALIRHLIDLQEMDNDTDLAGPIVDAIAWRALALSQKWHEAHGKPVAPAAVNHE